MTPTLRDPRANPKPGDALAGPSGCTRVVDYVTMDGGRVYFHSTAMNDDPYYTIDQWRAWAFSTRVVQHGDYPLTSATK